MFAEALAGIERELGRKAPIASRLTILKLQRRLYGHQNFRTRKQFEQDLEAFLQSRPFLRAATRRYITKKMVPLLIAAEEALREYDRFLAAAKTETPI
jgi:hypothetical protein